MAKQSRYGDGTISRLSDGRWEGRIEVPGGNGKRPRKRVRAATKAAVRDQLAEVRRQIQLGVVVTGRPPALRDYLRDWLEETIRPVLKNNTYEGYERNVRLHINPGLGHIPLNKLTTSELQKHFTRLLTNGMSPSMLDNVRRTLRSALNRGCDLRLIERNPIERLKLPSVATPEMAVLDVEQLQVLMAQILNGIDSLVASPEPLASAEFSTVYPWGALIALTAATGLRATEATGLTWDHLEGETLKIRHRLGRVLTSSDGPRRRREWSFEGLKTEESQADLIVPASVVTLLESHRELQARVTAATSTSSPWICEHHLMFTSVRGRPLHTSNVGAALKRILKACDLPAIRFHDLRHSYGTMLSEGNEPLREIQKAMRHKNSQVTQRYTHSTVRGRQKIAARVESTLFGTRQEVLTGANGPRMGHGDQSKPD